MAEGDMLERPTFPIPQLLFKSSGVFTITFFIVLNLTNYSIAENNFFEEGKSKYKEKKYEEYMFLFQI